MVNSKLSRKSLKKHSKKLKNKRTKKSKVSRKNVRKMKGGESLYEMCNRIKEQKDHYDILGISKEKKLTAGEIETIYSNILKQYLGPTYEEKLKTIKYAPTKKCFENLENAKNEIIKKSVNSKNGYMNVKPNENNTGEGYLTINPSES
jgi:hypothetical protein